MMKHVKKLLALALMIGGLCFAVTACQKAETPAPPPETSTPKVEQPAPPVGEAPATTGTMAAPAAAPATGTAATTR